MKTKVLLVLSSAALAALATFVLVALPSQSVKPSFPVDSRNTG